MNSPPSCMTGHDRRRERNRGDPERHLRPVERRGEQRTIRGDQEPVQRIRVLARDASAHKIAHQHRHERHRQPGGRRHRIALRVRERREKPSFLRLQREDGHERQRDDEQAEEERGPDLDRGVRDDRPPLVDRRLRRRLPAVDDARVRVLPRLELLVRVLDHHDGRIDHRADRDRDAAERHDVGVDTLHAHHDERSEHAERQRYDGDERRAQMEQEDEADQRDHRRTPRRAWSAGGRSRARSAPSGRRRGRSQRPAAARASAARASP